MRTKSVCRHGRGQGRVLMLRGMAYIVMALYVRVLMLRGMAYIVMALYVRVLMLRGMDYVVMGLLSYCSVRT